MAEQLNDDQLDGLACVRCGRRFDVGPPIASTVDITSPGPRGMLFRCFPRCAPPRPESDRADPARVLSSAAALQGVGHGR